MTYICTNCFRKASMKVDVPDHIPTLAICRQCRVYMLPVKS